MPHVRDVLSALELIAPARHAFEFDKVGLQVGDPNAEVKRAAVSLDRSLGAIEFARLNGCQLLLSHHPLIFTPLDTVDSRGHVGKSVLALAKAEISFIAAHTNWDAAKGGINDTLIEMFGLQNSKEFGTAAQVERLKLVTYVPSSHEQPLIDALSEAGAGVIGEYTRCAFTSEGKGTFLPGDGAKPFMGQRHEIETADEVRIEMVLPVARQRAVLKALQKSHPYEEPAYDFLRVAPVSERPSGRIGELPSPMSLRGFASVVDSTLSTRCWTWGDGDDVVRRVAIVGGAADGEWMNAQRAGADVLLTGEVKQHVAVEASESGMRLIAAGHYETEHPGSAALCGRMAQALPEIDWILFTPPAGLHGRMM